MALTGFLWSQGEANADSNTTDYYRCAFPLFIDDWRAGFKNTNAVFGFELLPAYTAVSACARVAAGSQASERLVTCAAAAGVRVRCSHPATCRRTLQQIQ